jgi:16S rRNA (guanine527-N7)-methyltransferase
MSLLLATPQQYQQLEQYQQLVLEYAKVLDLNSPRLLADFQIGLERSQPFAAEVIGVQSVLDVGSGSGLPGIPMAILCPQAHVTLCEIRIKRVAFLERVVSRLGLKNVTVHNGDVQRIQGQFDAVTALWFGSLEKLYSLTRHAFAPQWRLITRKGDGAEAELEAMRRFEEIQMFHVKQLPDGAQMVVLEGRR